MKRKFLMLAVVFTIFGSVFSASGAEIKPGTPSHAVKSFFTCMSKGDFAAAKKIVNAKELVGMLELIEKMYKENPDFRKEIAGDMAKMAKIRIVSEKVTGDSAEVVIIENSDGKGKKETLKLKKIGGVWKIVE